MFQAATKSEYDKTTCREKIKRKQTDESNAGCNMKTTLCRFGWCHHYHHHHYHYHHLHHPRHPHLHHHQHEERSKGNYVNVMKHI